MYPDSFEEMIADTYRHKGLRKKLVQEIAAKGITDQRVLDAMNKVPRHAFLTSAFLEFAYENKAFQIGAGQTISHPYTVAFQSQLLMVEPGMKVLEIGTGSGYQTAILCELGAKVYSVERQKILHEKAKNILREMGYKAQLTYGDGFKGMQAFAPFDRIIITCAAPRVSEELLLQLKPGGRIVVPFGEGEVQEMMTIDETESGEFVTKMHGTFSFVPMLENRNPTG
jgi:protein-L-isoaspartate(D-aspartate) O-methyltransferase